MHPFILIILIPIAAGLIGFVIDRLRNEFSFIGSVVSLYYAIRLFIQSRTSIVSLHLFEVGGLPIGFRLDALSGFILLFAAIFGVLVVLYSFRYMKTWNGTRGYYFYVLVALAGSFGVLLAANLVTLLVFWGFLLSILYGLLLVGREDAPRAANKALVVVGLSDFAMLLGIGILLVKNGWIDLAPRAPMSLTDPTMVLAFVLVAAGALAKAGSMPLHTWIPQASESSPITVMALVPAALDKLLGIYLLTRLSIYVFNIASSLPMRNVLMTIGAVTILGAAAMAIVQRRMRRVLAFSTVSQVGYMVLGIGTGTPVGIAGGLLHMLNNTLFKTGLFMSAGTVEYWAKTDDLDKLGGLARHMPLTFFSFLICGLAIAGVPPLNGFFSKWMVYQGVIDVGREGNRLFPVFLVAAMLGSVLTLAYVLKLLHSVFLGQRPPALAKVREGSFTMWLPPMVLALACIAFGIFAYQLPLRMFIYPSLPFYVEPFGIWQPVLTTLLVFIALGLGAVVYLLGTARRPTEGETFVGGEKIADDEESRVPGSALYTSVKQMPIIDDLLLFGGQGALDIFNWVKGVLDGLGALFRQGIDRVLDFLYGYLAELIRVTGRGLSRLQTGNLPLYVGFIFVGAIVFYLVLLLR